MSVANPSGGKPYRNLYDRLHQGSPPASISAKVASAGKASAAKATGDVVSKQIMKGGFKGRAGLAALGVGGIAAMVASGRSNRNRRAQTPPPVRGY